MANLLSNQHLNSSSSSSSRGRNNIDDVSTSDDSQFYYYDGEVFPTGATLASCYTYSIADGAAAFHYRTTLGGVAEWRP